MCVCVNVSVYHIYIPSTHVWSCQLVQQPLQSREDPVWPQVVKNPGAKVHHPRGHGSTQWIAQWWCKMMQIKAFKYSNIMPTASGSLKKHKSRLYQATVLICWQPLVPLLWFMCCRLAEFSVFSVNTWSTSSVFAWSDLSQGTKIRQCLQCNMLSVGPPETLHQYLLKLIPLHRVTHFHTKYTCYIHIPRICVHMNSWQNYLFVFMPCTN